MNIKKKLLSLTLIIGLMFGIMPQTKANVLHNLSTIFATTAVVLGVYGRACGYPELNGAVIHLAARSVFGFVAAEVGDYIHDLSDPYPHSNPLEELGLGGLGNSILLGIIVAGLAIASEK